MNIYEAIKEGDFTTTSLVGHRTNIDRCLDINKAVVEHCYNKFTKALEALKKTRDLANLWEGDDTERDWANELDFLIHELENVKINE